MDLERRAQGLGAKPALIVVDMVRGFTDPACPLGSESGPVVAANQSLLAVMRAKALPVIFTAVVYDHAHQGQAFRTRVPALNLLMRGSKWTELDEALARRDDEPVFEKHFASGFFGTELAPYLRAKNVDSLIVTGLTTSGCVRATAVDGLQHNWPVVVPREACGDRNPDAHTANLHDLHAKYADVVSLDEVLAMIGAL